ncbi:MAG: hypothetical protein B6244_05195 [Candidatus Cloacimonetes bacterium 4572_55]|nr:MAG: hypothetical protein B6244_05195 [Candidatus Cloacimonetes bacterium 4572_55]
MAKVVYMTKNSYNNLMQELEKLQLELRTTVAKEIGTAMAHGDLRENAEYEAAKAKQRQYALRMEELTGMLGVSSLIEDLQISGKSVSVGTRVTLFNLATAEEVVYNILGEGDGDIKKSIISYKTPIAQQMMIKERGDVAVIKVPAGTERFMIKKVEKIFQRRRN